MKSIVLLVDYFGQWPKYFHLFLLTCKHNPTIDWVIHTDCPIPTDIPENVTIIPITFEQYYDKVNKALNVNFSVPNDPYKVVDLRPAFGIIHADIIADYDYYGHTDLDVFYGNIRKFLPQEMTQDIITSRHGWVSGHFTLYANKEKIKHAYKLMPKWALWMNHPTNLFVDEYLFSTVVIKNHFGPFTQQDIQFMFNFSTADLILISDLQSLPLQENVSVYDVEQYSTPFGDCIWYDGTPGEFHPDTYFWKDGIIVDKNNHEYMYIHVMNFEKKRWVPHYWCTKTISLIDRLAHHKSWRTNPDVTFCDTPDKNNSFCIDWSGIHTREVV